MTSTTASSSTTGGFNAKVMIGVVAASILSLVGYLFLSAYAPDRKTSGDSHAWSDSAIGYSAIVKLRQELNRNPRLLRSAKALETDELVILTPELTTDPEELQKKLDERGGRTTLIILPKRVVQSQPFKTGWVRGRTVAQPGRIEKLMSKIVSLKVTDIKVEDSKSFYADWMPTITFGKKRVVQTVSGDNLISYMDDNDGHMLLAGLKSYEPAVAANTLATDQVAGEPSDEAPAAEDAPNETRITREEVEASGEKTPDQIANEARDAAEAASDAAEAAANETSDNEEASQPLIYIMADPDVFNNFGMADENMAVAATTMLDNLASDDAKSANFDLTLNGFGERHSLLQLIFEPPYLALSLCLFVASIMALMFGLMRFGPPMREKRAVAPGKTALVTNTADLLRLAGRQHEVGERYANLTRDMAAQSLGLPQSMSAQEVTTRLDRVSREGDTFSTLARTSGLATTLDEMLATARALYHWRKDKAL